MVAGFAIYLWNIVSGEITETMHKEWVKQLKKYCEKRRRRLVSRERISLSASCSSGCGNIRVFRKPMCNWLFWMHIH